MATTARVRASAGPTRPITVNSNQPAAALRRLFEARVEERRVGAIVGNSTSAPNPKFAHVVLQGWLRTSGSRGTRIVGLLVSL